jgi:hypothetical protein
VFEYLISGSQRALRARSVLPNFSRLSVAFGVHPIRELHAARQTALHPERNVFMFVSDPPPEIIFVPLTVPIARIKQYQSKDLSAPLRAVVGVFRPKTWGGLWITARA